MSDPYVAYIQRFFARWQRVYDLFARSIFPVYDAAAARATPAEGLSVLDLCTGTGEMAVRCARRGAEVTGIDITEPMLRHARRKAAGLPIRLLAIDARHLPFQDRSFDSVVLSFALHDMPRRVRLDVLREALRVARERVVILDYDLGTGPVGRLFVRLIGMFETAYFKPFAREGVAPLLEQFAPIEVDVRRYGGMFAIRVVRAALPGGASYLSRGSASSASADG